MRMKSIIYTAVSLGLIAAAAVIGAETGKGRESELAVKETVKTEEYLLPGAEMVFSYEYGCCGHVEEKTVIAKDEAGMTEKELEALYADTFVSEFSPEKVRFEKLMPGYCRLHITAYFEGECIKLYRAGEYGEETGLLGSYPANKIKDELMAEELKAGKVFPSVLKAEEYIAECFEN